MKIHQCSKKLVTPSHIKNTHWNAVVLIFRYIQCLHLMNSEVAWVLVSLGTQVQPQKILDPDYLPDYLSVSYDYVATSLFNFICMYFLYKNYPRILEV